MTTYPIPAHPGAWDHTPWQRWVAEVGDPALRAAWWAARLLAVWAGALAAVTLVWPLRLAARLWRWCWADPERAVCTVVFGGPIALLVRVAPTMSWPGSYGQALADLRTAGLVLAVAFLGLTAAGTAGGAGVRPFVPSPYGGATRTRRWTIAVHEAGHLVIGKALGRRTGGARIWANSGLTQVWPRLSDLKGEVAINWAGMIAAGTEWGGDGDKAITAAMLRHLTSAQQRTVLAAGKALARRKVGERSGEIKRVARKLYDAPNGTAVR